MAMQSQTQATPSSTLLMELHSATRSEHTSLNKAITTRLPLCLPPVAPNPHFYTAGMTVYGQVYFAMELTWRRLLQNSESISLNTRYHEMLLTLETQYLARIQRLESDLQNLRGMLDVAAKRSLDQLQIQSSHFRDEVSSRIRAKPYLIIAYAWPMYLALFNGGRWIANQLVAAGPDFWQSDAETTTRDFLSFWYFDDSVYDEHHGDNVKIDFKQRLNAVSGLLTESERAEVIIEVKRVFGICAEMVTLLDQHAQKFEKESQDGMPDSSGKIQGVTGWITSMTTVKNAWQGLRALIGYTTPPTVLRKDFEQHT